MDSADAYDAVAFWHSFDVSKSRFRDQPDTRQPFWTEIASTTQRIWRPCPTTSADFEPQPAATLTFYARRFTQTGTIFRLRCFGGLSVRHQPNHFRNVIGGYPSHMRYFVTDLLQSGSLSTATMTELTETLSEIERVLMSEVEQGEFLPRQIVMRF